MKNNNSQHFIMKIKLENESRYNSIGQPLTNICNIRDVANHID